MSGRPVVRSGDGRGAAPGERLRIVARVEDPGAGKLPPPPCGVSPEPVFFDAPAKIRYRFRARGRADLALRLVRARTGETVRRWSRRDVTPYAKHTLGWNGTADGGRHLRSGRYVLRIGHAGSRGQPGPRFRLYDAKFPVRGPHNFGGAEQRFGAPRSGGRIHQGQDTFAACGTREVAAVGGKVQARGFDPVLYGNWLVIDGRGSTTDYRYAHLIAPTPLHTRRARQHRELSAGSAGRATPAPSAACSTSRSGRRAGSAAARSTLCPFCCVGTGTHSPSARAGTAMMRTARAAIVAWLDRRTATCRRRHGEALFWGHQPNRIDGLATASTTRRQPDSGGTAASPRAIWRPSTQASRRAHPLDP